ncbi:MAG: hypothetical protein PHI64_07010 [Zoogloea sp.]|uniref:hypothetical protein n=1 Tax=Zoogloea sp. TaxID=49181 RepID=UPI00261035C8|nr:hypothetical protein [Zoogloea sp.]MDD2988694.1 hypothetical protein [Zoogloea sp.]
MDAHLFAALGLLALGMIAWQAWRERAVELRRIPSDWQLSIDRIARGQAQGHHRQVRDSVLQACLRLQQYPRKSHVVPHVRVRLAALLQRDPLYPELVRAIRAACASGAEISETSLCVSSNLLLEDVRQCMALAELFGQIERHERHGELMIAAGLHPSA